MVRFYSVFILFLWAQDRLEALPRWVPVTAAWYATIEVLLLGAYVLLLQQCTRERTVPLKLVRPVSTPATPPPPGPEVHADTLSALSLSGTSPSHSYANGRSPPPAQPVFGRQSLGLTPPPRDDSEPMDWEPTATGSPTQPSSDWDTFGIGRQNMFPRTSASEETGLEGLLASWGLGTDTRSHAASASSVSGTRDVQMMPAEDSLTWLRSRLDTLQRFSPMFRVGMALVPPQPQGVRLGLLVVEALLSGSRAVLSNERWTAIVNSADAIVRLSTVVGITRGLQAPLPLLAPPYVQALVESLAWALLTKCVNAMTS